MRNAVVVVVVLIFVALLFFVVGTKDEVDVTRILLQGTWISTQDAKFAREFKEDGTVIDTYEGSSPDAEGRWTLFTREMQPEGYEGELENAPIYLAIGIPNSEPLYFKITKIDENALELVYLNRGGALIFTKVK